MKTYLRLLYLAEFFLEWEMFETNLKHTFYVGQLFPKIVSFMR